MRLSWRGTIAHGTYYTVHRRLGAGQPFEMLGSPAAREFVDETLPAGTAEATYFVRTLRDGQASDDSEPITVRLGTPGAQQGGEGGLSLAA
jgi:hypothetical protein